MESSRYIDHGLQQPPATSPESLSLAFFQRVRRFLDSVQCPNKLSIASDPSQSYQSANIYNGSGGYALLYLRLHNFFSLIKKEGLQAMVGPDQIKQRLVSLDLLSMCQKQLQTSFKIKESKAVSYYFSKEGLLLIEVQLSLLMNRKIEADRCVKKIIQLEAQASKTKYSEILYGRTGYLYMLNKLKKLGIQEISPNRMMQAVIEDGIKGYTQKYRKKPDLSDKQFRLVYDFHGTQYFGGAHGLAGILQILFKTVINFQLNKQFLKKHFPFMLASLRYMLIMQNKDGGWSSSFKPASHSSKLVQFCHGSPGVGIMLCTAIQMLGKLNCQKQLLQGCMRSLRQAMKNVWEKGLLKKGDGICHGITGNGYLFQSCLKLSKKYPEIFKEIDPRSAFRYYATAGLEIKFSEIIEQFQFSGRLNKGKPDSPFSLMEGVAGDIISSIDCLTETGGLPGYDDI